MRFPESLKSMINFVGMIYVRFVCKREYNLQTFVDFNERPIEFSFLFDNLSRSWPKSVLDVGTGMTALPHLMRNCGFVVTAIDNIEDYWPYGMTNRHYHVVNDDITRTKIEDRFDFITCISVLEHIKDHREAMRSMFKLLNPGGHLIITFPYNEGQYVKNAYDLPGSCVRIKYPFVTQVFSREEMDSWLEDSPFKVSEQEYWRFFEGEFWTCGDRLDHPIKVSLENSHHLSCICLIKPNGLDT
tara:strand:+ start:1561 stop:2289 length:729 start_codon:yes stop_codon:yes gene_type:complete